MAGVTRPYTQTSQRLGFNLALPTSAGWSNMYQDSGPVQSFYFDNVPSGAIDSSTGFPTSGNTSLTIQLREGVKYNAGTYDLTWTGGGTVAGNSSPSTLVVSASQADVTLNCVGAVSNFTMTQPSPTGTYTSTFTARANRGNCFRIMEAWRINEDGGTSAASYNTSNPYIRERAVTGGNTFYHRSLTPTMVGDLGNDFTKDLWLCFHHRASDTNITDAIDDIIATGFSGTIYVEHSNEVWNSAFPQYSYATSQSGTNYNGAPGEAQSVAAWHADRTIQIGAVAKAAYSGCRTVYGSQTAVPNFYNSAVNYATEDISEIDDVAISFYFGGPPARALSTIEGQALTASELAGLGQDDFDNRVVPLIEQWKAYADVQGWPVLGYEGGPHFDHSDSTTEEHYSTLAQSSDVGDVMGNVFDWWDSNLGTLAMVFQDVGDGNDPWSFYAGELGSTQPRWQAFLDRAA